MINFSWFKSGLITASLLASAIIWAPLADAAPKNPTKTFDKSDLNNDGSIDYQDIALFSSNYLEQNVETVDWCAFLDAMDLQDDLYGRPPQFYLDRFSPLLSFISDYFGCGDRSDLNGDHIVNARDLMAFSEQYVNEHFLRVDWCLFQQAILDGAPVFGEPADFFLVHYGELILLIQDKFKCTDTPPDPEDPLALKNSPKFLTRIAASRNLTGDYYVTDARVGSVFIYDSNLQLTHELKGLEKPLGIAVNSSGHILVGNDKRNNVEVYDPDNGELLASFGLRELEMPTAITVDSQDNIYVTDTRSNTVYMYDSSYQLIRAIGEPGNGEDQLKAPADAALNAAETELLVLDRLNKVIKVFDLEGHYLRTILPYPGKCSWFSGCTGGTPFTRLQAAELAGDGTLHVLDIFDVVIGVYNTQTGGFVSRYGSAGTTAGTLKSPMDLLVEPGRALVVDGGKNTIEILSFP